MYYYGHASLPTKILPLLCMFVSFLVIPVVFRLFMESRVDRFIGDLSYPMYLTHILGKWIILGSMGVSKKDAVSVPGWQLLLVTVVLSVPLVIFIDHPIDRWRQARLKKRMSRPISVLL